MVEEDSGFPLAYPLARKGVTDNDWLIQMMTAEIETLGFGGLDVIRKSDQEHAIVAVKEAVQCFRMGSHAIGGIGRGGERKQRDGGEVCEDDQRPSEGDKIIT